MAMGTKVVLGTKQGIICGMANGSRVGVLWNDNCVGWYEKNELTILPN